MQRTFDTQEDKERHMVTKEKYDTLEAKLQEVSADNMLYY